MNAPVLHWSLNLSALLPVLAYATIYARRFRLARREGSARGARPRHAIAFAAAMVVMLVAVASPLDGLGEEYLFTAHMTQHILLGDIAPLLVLLSLSRVIMRPATRRLQRVEVALGRFAHPVTGLLVWFALVYFWHIPALYVAAIENPAVHALEHASFFAAGVAVWWPLVQPVPMRRRMTGLAPFAYIGAAKAGLAALGLFLTWSSTVAYPFYETVPRVWGLSAIEDQNLGGAIMMVEQSLTFVTVLVAVFVRMLSSSEAEELRRERLEESGVEAGARP